MVGKLSQIKYIAMDERRRSKQYLLHIDSYHRYNIIRILTFDKLSKE